MAKKYYLLTDQEIVSIIREVVDQILIPRFYELKMNASGKWVDSLAVTYDGNGTAKIRGQYYSYWLAKGRNPNANQDPEVLRRWAVWAGNTFIKQWVQDKGIAADPIAVAYSIARKGTSWKRSNGSDLLEVLTYPKTIEFIQQRIKSVVRPKVAEALRRNAIETFRNQ